MPRLAIRHETTYRYDRPVRFGAWRLMMRPADTHAVRLVSAELALTPPGATRWTFDAASNSVCHYEPQGESDILQVVSALVIDRYPAPLRAAELAAPLLPANALAPAVLYAPDDLALLAPYLKPVDEPYDQHLDWMRAQARHAGENALDFLIGVSRAIQQGFSYSARAEYGTQTPAETVARGAGTCRDFAWLMIESARRWGFAARFVTGYLYSPDGDGDGHAGAGATHAWCEVFLPDLGWLEFDPTNGLAESPDLIRVAAARTPQEASPMQGEVLTAAEGRLEVSVRVSLLAP
ncbi:MAG: transglutaminase domain-containing protein [Hyphomonadaceae bacterium]